MPAINCLKYGQFDEQIADHHLSGCRTAVEDFRSQSGIKAELKTIDFGGRYWRKDE